MADIPSYESDFFKTAHHLIDMVLTSATQGKLSEYTGIGVELAKYGITIYALIYAFQTLAGRQKTPVPDFVWNMAKLAIIFMFVRNSDGWMTRAIGAVDGLKTTLAGGQDPWLWLDQLWVKVNQVSALLMQIDTSTYVKLDGGIGAFFTYIGAFIALLSASIVFFSAEITLKILTVTAPLFIACLMFGFLRQMFNNWLQLIFSAILTLMFSTLALRAGTSYLNHILTVLISSAEKSNLIAMGAMALAAGVFTAFVAWKAAQFASQIASVGVEGTLQGAAALGIGTGAFMGRRLMGSTLDSSANFIKGGYSGILRKEGGFGLAEGSAGKTGNLIGQGTNITAGKLRDAAIAAARKKYGS